MHNLTAGNVVELVMGIAAVAFIASYVVSCVGDGRIQTRGGGVLRRDRNPVGFWFVMSWASGVALLCGAGVVVRLAELMAR